MSFTFRGSRSGHPIPRVRHLETIDSPVLYQAFKQYFTAELEELLTAPGVFGHRDAEQIRDTFLAQDKLPQQTLITDLFARCTQDVHLSHENYDKLYQRWFSPPAELQNANPAQYAPR